MNTVNKSFKNITITFIKLIKDFRFKIQLIIFFSKKERTTSLLMLISLAVVMIISTNIGYCMTPEENAKAIADELRENNADAARELLERFANENPSASQMMELDELINTELNRNPNNIYGINQSNLHNTGNPGDYKEINSIISITWRDVALALLVAATFTISIYLIYKYWDDIKNTLFGTTQNIRSIRTVRTIGGSITNPLQLAMLRRLESLPPEIFTPRFIALTLAIINRIGTDAEE